jgi:hypothetical protein
MIGHNGAPSLDTVADTANELLAPTCLNPELSAWNDPNCPVSLEYVPDGPERDLRGMPKDLSHYYKSAAVLDWSVSAQRHRLNKLSARLAAVSQSTSVAA